MFFEVKALLEAVRAVPTVGYHDLCVPGMRSERCLGCGAAIRHCAKDCWAEALKRASDAVREALEAPHDEQAEWDAVYQAFHELWGKASDGQYDKAAWMRMQDIIDRNRLRG